MTVTPKGRRTTKTPTPAGAALLREFKRLGYPDLNSAARAADVADENVRRLVYTDQKTMSLRTASRLRKLGVSEAVLSHWA